MAQLNPFLDDDDDEIPLDPVGSGADDLIVDEVLSRSQAMAAEGSLNTPDVDIDAIEVDEGARLSEEDFADEVGNQLDDLTQELGYDEPVISGAEVGMPMGRGEAFTDSLSSGHSIDSTPLASLPLMEEDQTQKDLSDLVARVNRQDFGGLSTARNNLRQGPGVG